MQTPETHTSREIAQAIVDRVWPRQLPRSVPVTRRCEHCDGDGTVLIERPARYLAVSPDYQHVSCSECDDGVQTVLCECWGHGAATTVLFDDAVKPSYWCAKCMASTCQHGVDAVIFWGLRVMQGPGSIEDLSAEEIR